MRVGLGLADQSSVIDETKHTVKSCKIAGIHHGAPSSRPLAFLDTVRPTPCGPEGGFKFGRTLIRQG
jgi:hypothetical protein